LPAGFFAGSKLCIHNPNNLLWQLLHSLAGTSATLRKEMSLLCEELDKMGDHQHETEAQYAAKESTFTVKIKE